MVELINYGTISTIVSSFLIIKHTHKHLRMPYAQHDQCDHSNVMSYRMFNKEYIIEPTDGNGVNYPLSVMVKPFQMP